MIIRTPQPPNYPLNTTKSDTRQRTVFPEPEVEYKGTIRTPCKKPQMPSQYDHAYFAANLDLALNLAPKKKRT